jgi:signal transduction histidine kinase
VVTTVVVSAALVWAGLRLLGQQRTLDEQWARNHAESVADSLAADVRGKLADAGERLSSWVSNPSSPAPAIRTGVVVTAQQGGIEVSPPDGLPYVPVSVNTPQADVFLSLEAMEFRGDAAQALDGYRALANEPDGGTRAGALMRLARLQRKSKNLNGALVTYQQLADLGNVRVADLPAELVGLDGERATYLALADREHANDVAQRMLQRLDGGRWRITRGVAEFYRESFTTPRPPSWRLANALSEVWTEIDRSRPPRGYRLFNASGATSSVLVLWRSNSSVTAAFAVEADRFFDLAEGTPASWQLVDAEGSVISGPRTSPVASVARIIDSYPWTLRTWTDSPSISSASDTRTILIAMMGAMLAFVWGASYFIARAIRHEAAVVRLRSNFVAAVSHEFRSPLTAIRQMAEMLDADRVLSDDRRQKYYRVLAAEAGRLQRLVETLLSFGRMEAHGARYRFVDLDAATLVQEVVADTVPQARELGKAIQIEAPDAELPIRGDHAALSVAIRNLVDNAMKYSPGEPTIWVRCRKERESAMICVIDRGVGIPRSEQRSIFDDFVRGRTAIDANICGTGVGLAIVRQIIAAHGGEIRLESEIGRGSTFTVVLPTLN